LASPAGEVWVFVETTRGATTDGGLTVRTRSGAGRATGPGVAEVSLYVSASARGHGVGEALLRELVRASEAAGLWTLQAGIFPENVASLRLHQKCGFRVLGVRQRVGCLAGRWRDVVLLERRSATAGA